MPKLEKHFQDTQYLKALGAHCKNLRKKAGFTINRMSDKGVRLSPSVVFRLESGEGPVTVLVLLRYAHVLNLHPKKLLDFAFDTEHLDEL